MRKPLALCARITLPTGHTSADPMPDVEDKAEDHKDPQVLTIPHQAAFCGARGLVLDNLPLRLPRLLRWPLLWRRSIVRGGDWSRDVYPPHRGLQEVVVIACGGLSVELADLRIRYPSRTQRGLHGA